MDNSRYKPYIRCVPYGICIFCCQSPDQIETLGVSYCKYCKDHGIIDHPSKFYPKCDTCGRWHDTSINIKL